MMKRLVFFAFWIAIVFAQWRGNNFKVLNEDGYSWVFNGESSGFTPSDIGNDTIIFDNLNLNYDSVTIEIWSRYSRTVGAGNVNTPPIRQPVLFYGSDSTHYLWISAADGISGNYQTAPNSVFGIRANTTRQEVTFRAFDVPQAWTHLVISLQPSNIGSSYVWGLGAGGAGTPISFSTTVTTSSITGNTKLMLGGVTNDLLTELGNPGAYTGRLAEIRIWNHFIPSNQINATRFVSLTGSEQGLVHWWKVANTTAVIDKVGSRNGNSYGPVIDYVFKDRQDMIPLYIFNRQIPFNGYSEFSLAFNDPDLPTPSFGFFSNPSFGRLCVVSNSICTNVPFLLTSDHFVARVYPDRGSCGNTINMLARVTTDTVSTNSIQLSVVVGNLTGTTFTSSTLVPTIGGYLTIQGTNLGIPGPLASNEIIQIQFASGTVDCTNGTATTDSLVCLVPPGVGYQRPISVKICASTFSLTGVTFSYERPDVFSVLSNSFQQISIAGTNFGPFRTFNNLTDSVTVFNSSGSFPCAASTLNDSIITCRLNNTLENGYNYSLNVKIGGQVLDTSFIFQICNPLCQHGGVCLASGKCLCSSTGYEGSACEIPIPCQPLCKNGGICVRPTGSDAANSTYGVCQCVGDYAPPDCNLIAENTGTNVGPIVGGVVGGAALILIVSIVVVVLIFKRREKREGANFIPLEKKDFTKIIYGDQLNQTPDKSAGNLKDLEKLLVGDEGLAVSFAISAVTQITEADKIAKAMIVVFQDNDKVIKLLESFIEEEVRTTESAGTLFRANSMVSKMFKFYSRLIGLPYLYVTIGPELGKLIEEELGLEVDPEKMEEGRDLDEMRWALMSQSQKILKQILISDDKCPPQFRVLFAHIAKCVGSRFPDNVNTTIGGFIFLRLFCPAVSSPEAYGIVEEPPSPDSRRLLILITKVMQNLSNDVEFGSKEPYMTKMNDFIQSNRLKLITFYEKLLKPPTKPPVPCELPKNIKTLSLIVLAQHIRDNLEKIEDSQIKAKLQSVLPPE